MEIRSTAFPTELMTTDAGDMVATLVLVQSFATAWALLDRNLAILWLPDANTANIELSTIVVLEASLAFVPWRTTWYASYRATVVPLADPSDALSRDVVNMAIDAFSTGTCHPIR